MLREAGRNNLARRVVWLGHEEGDGAGYDSASFSTKGSAHLIAVKTTNGWDRTALHISRNKLRTADQRRDARRLLRIFNDTPVEGVWISPST